jgi:ankyrin repeat protein
MRSSRSDSLEFLLNDGADINMQDKEGTILHSATMKFDLERVRLLLAKGANVNAINETYGTPLQALFGGFIVTLGNTWSHRTSQLEEYITSFKDSKLSMIFNLLIENGADVDLHGGYYNMALNAICTKIGLFSNSDIVSEKIQLLINQGADVNASVSHYGTAIHVACDSYSRLYRSSDESPYDFDQLKRCLQLLIQHGADINSQEKGYRTPLQLICGRSHDADVIDHVRSLIEMGADVNIQSDEYGSALHAAGGEGWWAGKSTDRVLELLLKNGAEVDLQGNKRPGTPLQSACKWGNKNVMQLLLKYGANVNAPGGRYGTALIAACSFYNYPGWQNSPFGFHMEIVRSLLEHGADVNAVAALYDEDESTALIAACNTKNLVVVQLLLQNGADVNLCDGFALHAAVDPRNPYDTEDLLKLLLSHGCDINHVHEEYGTALSYFVTFGEYRHDIAARRDEQIIRFLLDNGADVNLIGGALGFALQAACTERLQGYVTETVDVNKHSNITKFLLENCPDINVNAEGGPFGSALQAASHSGQTQSVRMLLERKANVGAYGGKYGSALNAAIVRGHWNIVEILLEAGAIPDCHLQQCPDEGWLQRIKEGEDEYEEKRRNSTQMDCELKRVSGGSLAVKRYRKFWEVETRQREEKLRREELQLG